MHSLETEILTSKSRFIIPYKATDEYIWKEETRWVICHWICKILFLVLITRKVKLVQIWVFNSLQPVTNVRKKLIHEKVPQFFSSSRLYTFKHEGIVSTWKELCQITEKNFVIFNTDLFQDKCVYLSWHNVVKWEFLLYILSCC